MFKRLKKFLRDWLLDDPDDFSIDVCFEIGSTRTMEAKRAAGSYLICQRTTDVSVETLLVSRATAVDRDRFDELWYRLSSRQNMTWEDGTPAVDMQL